MDDCKSLKIPLCGPCLYNIKYSSKMLCEIQWYNIHLSHITTKQQFKHYILNSIITASYIHNFEYLRYTVENKFPLFLNLYDNIILLK